jgi:uncharacterized protein YbaR (Trm112 family)
MLKQSDLVWLACPVCHQALALEVAMVRCNGCGRKYPIVDGIPILLVDQAS